jgi:hypothetical protein
LDDCIFGGFRLSAMWLFFDSRMFILSCVLSSHIGVHLLHLNLKPSTGPATVLGHLLNGLNLPQPIPLVSQPQLDRLLQLRPRDMAVLQRRRHKVRPAQIHKTATQSGKRNLERGKGEVGPRCYRPRWGTVRGRVRDLGEWERDFEVSLFRKFVGV